MADFEINSTAGKTQQKLEPIGTQLLRESQEVANKAVAEVKSTLSSFGHELYDNPKTTLATLAVGAAALYLTKGEGVTKIAQALSKSKELDATTLEVPSLEVLGKIGHSEHGLLAKSLKEQAAVSERLKADTAGEGHLDFGEQSIVSAKPVNAGVSADQNASSLADIDLTKKDGIKFKATDEEDRKALERLTTAREPELRRLAARNEELTPEQAVKLSQDSDIRVVREAYENPKMPPENLAAASKHPDGYVRDAIAKNVSTPPETLREMANQTNDYQVPSDVLANPSTPPDVRAALQKKLDRDGDFLPKVTGDPETDSLCSQEIKAPPKERTELGRVLPPRTEEEIRKLADSDNVYDRQEAASHRNAPEDVQLKLATDTDPDVKKWLAGNDTASSKALDVLAKDSDKLIRKQAAQNPNLSPNSAADLGDDENIDVRRAAYANRNMPPEKLTAATSDQDAWIRGDVVRNSSSPAEALRASAARTDADWNARRRIQYHKNTPEDVRAPLKAEEDRFNIAKREDSTTEDLAPLVTAPESDTRQLLAAHKNASPDSLRNLAEDPEREVRLAALKNPNVPPDALVKASTSSDYVERWDVASHPSTPPETLRAMETDPNYTVRRFLESNPSTPEDVATRLRLERFGQ
ncbi:MAG: hypothetical protein P4L53_07535 [Candidatus Obscuribacterales bacterium]|nr:hypothetical protein [Candidatus Obscuribacterales bacterium]